jgi:hypothetical protein
MRIDPTKLSARVAYWRKLLLIEKPWDVGIKIVARDVDLPEADRGSAGTCEPDSSYFQADLTFCEENISTELELESTIVHELLHILLHPLELAARSSMGEQHADITDMLLESTIEKLSRAYVAVSRRKVVSNE